MKTAVKLSFSITLCYQGNYYVDDNGEWNFVGNLFIAGAGGSIRVSMPFVLCYIPCFAYFTASINVNIYMGIFANNDGETGSSVALTLDQLDDANASTFQGVYELKIGLGAGVGVGLTACSLHRAVLTLSLISNLMIISEESELSECQAV